MPLTLDVKSKLVYNRTMTKLIVSIFLGFSLVLGGCSLPQIQDTVEDASTQFDRDVADLEKALSLVQATLVVARPAAAKVCRKFPATCADLAAFQAEAELAVAEAQKTLDRVRETKQGISNAIDDIAFATKVVDNFLTAISAVLASAA